MAARKGYRQCQKCGRNRAERFYLPAGRICAPCQSGRVSAASRGTRLMDSYGITLAQYDTMLAHQGGACAICKGKRRGNLDVDHSHADKVVRGLLCRRCNRRLLPSCKDTVEILEAAIRYLESPPAVDAIGVIDTPL